MSCDPYNTNPRPDPWKGVPLKPDRSKPTMNAAHAYALVCLDTLATAVEPVPEYPERIRLDVACAVSEVEFLRKFPEQIAHSLQYGFSDPVVLGSL